MFAWQEHPEQTPHCDEGSEVTKTAALENDNKINHSKFLRMLCNDKGPSLVTLSVSLVILMNNTPYWIYSFIWLVCVSAHKTCLKLFSQLLSFLVDALHSTRFLASFFPCRVPSFSQTDAEL